MIVFPHHHHFPIPTTPIRLFLFSQQIRNRLFLQALRIALQIGWADSRRQSGDSAPLNKANSGRIATQINSLSSLSQSRLSLFLFLLLFVKQYNNEIPTRNTTWPKSRSVKPTLNSDVICTHNTNNQI